MKNVNLLCKMAIMIKEVPKCNKNSTWTTTCCLIGNTYHVHLLNKEDANNLSYNYNSAWLDTFNIDDSDAYNILYPTGELIPPYCTGLDYYRQIVKLLRKHQCLQFLRRMENHIAFELEHDPDWTQ